MDAGKYTSSNAAAIAARRVGGLSPLTAAYTEIYGERARERGSEGARERGSEGARESKPTNSSSCRDIQRRKGGGGREGGRERER